MCQRVLNNERNPSVMTTPTIMQSLSVRASVVACDFDAVTAGEVPH